MQMNNSFGMVSRQYKLGDEYLRWNQRVFEQVLLICEKIFERKFQKDIDDEYREERDLTSILRLGNNAWRMLAGLVGNQCCPAFKNTRWEVSCHASTPCTLLSGGDTILYLHRCIQSLLFPSFTTVVHVNKRNVIATVHYCKWRFIEKMSVAFVTTKTFFQTWLYEKDKTRLRFKYCFIKTFRGSHLLIRRSNYFVGITRDFPLRVLIETICFFVHRNRNNSLLSMPLYYSSLYISALPCLTKFSKLHEYNMQWSRWQSCTRNCLDLKTKSKHALLESRTGFLPSL